MKFKDLIRSGHLLCLNKSTFRIMKLIVLFMTAFLIQVNAAGFAQNITFVKHNASLKELFAQIRKQTGYNVFWQNNKVNDQPNFEADFKNESIQNVLGNVLGKKLTYSIVNKTIVIKEREQSLFDKVVDYFARINVSGKVLDAETGQPIPYVTVTLKGTNRQVSTNENGTFYFNSVPENGSFIFSNVSYNTTEATISKTMVIKLSAHIQKLDDVVVSTGYQQVRKGATTGSFSVLTEKDIENAPSLNLMERIEGKVPGVRFDVRNNTIQMRGINGFSKSSPPLIVIDGFPAVNQNLVTVSNGLVDGNPNNVNQPTTSGNAILDNINPNDIESIAFLKDAAAASIWGASAANGVIVITTKRGKRAMPTVTYSATLSTSAPGNFSNVKALSNSQYIDLEREMFDKGFLTDPTSNWRYGAISEAQEWMFRVKRGTATAAQRDSALNVLSNRSNRSQLRQYLLQNAATQQHNLSISGGGNNSTYYLSSNYSKDIPVYRGNSGETYSLSSNLTNDFLDRRILVTTNINYTYSTSKVNNAALAALSTGQLGFAPYEILVDGRGNPITKQVTFTQRVQDSLVRLGYMPWGYNAIDELNYNNVITNKNSIRLVSSIRGIITGWLNVTLSGQYQRGMNNQYNLQNLNSFATRTLVNTGTTFSGKIPIYGVPNGGVYKTSNSTFDTYSVRGQLNINKNWAQHHFDFLGGAEIKQDKYLGGTQTRYGYNEDLSTSSVFNPTVNYTTIYGYSTNLGYSDGNLYKNTKRNLSYFALASYSYKNKYFASGSVRFEDYTNQGLDRKQRAIPLYSGGLRWTLNREDFLKDVKWLSNLSLRGSIGTGGSIPNSGASYATISVGSNDPYTSQPTGTIFVPANSHLTWETTRTINEGIDAEFFNGRLSLTADVYQKRNYNLLIVLPYNATYGFTTLQYNAGNAKGNGYEFMISGQPVMNKNWNWTSSFNFSYTANEITDQRLANTNTNGAQAVIAAGYPTDNIVVYRWAGLDNKGQSRIYGADGSILNVSGSRSITPADLKYGGRTTPPYFGGFTNSVRYQNLTLTTRVTYALGHKFMLTDITGSNFPTGTSVSGLVANSERLAARWRNPGDEAFTNIPGLAGNNFNNIDRFVKSDYNLKDAGNVRFAQVSLNYALPQSILGKVKFIKTANIGASVTNLGLIWRANKEGVDPDYQVTGQYTNLPPSKTYLFNLTVSL